MNSDFGIRCLSFTAPHAHPCNQLVSAKLFKHNTCTPIMLRYTRRDALLAITPSALAWSVWRAHAYVCTRQWGNRTLPKKYHPVGDLNPCIHSSSHALSSVHLRSICIHISRQHFKISWLVLSQDALLRKLVQNSP